MQCSIYSGVQRGGNTGITPADTLNSPQMAKILRARKYISGMYWYVQERVPRHVAVHHGADRSQHLEIFGAHRY